jgi:hypothetical protein
MPITEYYRGTKRVVEGELLAGLSQTERTTFLYTGDDPYPGLRYVGAFDLKPGEAAGQYGIPDDYVGPMVLMQFPKLTRPSKGWRRHVRREKAARHG